ncbi:hypothetical protein D7V32_13935 [Acinetobacter tianfuensis]|uniref:Uncharacterized protein n=1 Tax=Acinetobacter tianfuensis TaxID=2419603 RepID=A0A3A8ELD5_9GAMM|nr:hypothetical protein D7V32_13935 [Acinetobacter tianfuensis]
MLFDNIFQIKAIFIWFLIIIDNDFKMKKVLNLTFLVSFGISANAWPMIGTALMKQRLAVMVLIQWMFVSCTLKYIFSMRMKR